MLATFPLHTKWGKNIKRDIKKYKKDEKYKKDGKNIIRRSNKWREEKVRGRM
jgi:hypothetical protein